MRNGTDSQRGAEPRSVKKSPFDCDAATTVRRPISAHSKEWAHVSLFDHLRGVTKKVEQVDVDCALRASLLKRILLLG